mmetsp:Transcript_11898/g.32642  ORF Transcript_11898/g.32642 Transcript_11898/m.32642 type:complete len:242 (-) Transcript_11898:950-1675(-)
MHPRQFRAALKDILAIAGHSYPEGVRQEIVRAERHRAFARICPEPVVIVDVLQERILVVWPRGGVVLHVHEGLPDAICAPCGRGRNDRRHIHRQVRQHQHHDQHQEDHAASGEGHELFAHTTLVVHLIVGLFRLLQLLLVVPVFFQGVFPGEGDGAAALLADISATHLARNLLEVSPVQLHDAHQPQDPDHAAHRGAEAGRTAAARLVAVGLLGLGHLVRDPGQVQDDRARGHEVEPEEET